jgi:NAD(P)-dependent dehydrogenase (short-subunit alcohol dehydrogenase family)
MTTQTLPSTTAAQDLSGRRALVTGGSRGIGAAIVRRLLDAGATVLTTARSATADVPDGALFVEADVRRPQAVAELARIAVDRLGGVDILVNNAGAGQVYTDGTQAIPAHEWQDALDINFLSSVWLDAAVLPAMRERRSGVIVHISSAVVHEPPGPFLHYAAAKAALNTYSRGLALEQAPYGVRVNAVVPGHVATPGADVARQSFADAAGVELAEVTSDIPLGRIGHPRDIAEMVAFLVSDRASWTTGRAFTVDGGGSPQG